jgi:hypothetical protein
MVAREFSPCGVVIGRFDEEFTDGKIPFSEVIAILPNGFYEIVVRLAYHLGHLAAVGQQLAVFLEHGQIVHCLLLPSIFIGLDDFFDFVQDGFGILGVIVSVDDRGQIRRIHSLVPCLAQLIDNPPLGFSDKHEPDFNVALQLFPPLFSRFY